MKVNSIMDCMAYISRLYKIYYLDIDECLNTLVCGKDQICVNTVGSYLCTCAIGFLYNTKEETCDGRTYFHQFGTD